MVINKDTIVGHSAKGGEILVVDVDPGASSADCGAVTRIVGAPHAKADNLYARCTRRWLLVMCGDLHVSD